MFSSHALIICTIKYFAKKHFFSKLHNSEMSISEEGFDL